MAFYIPTYDLLFIHIPKTAGTSIVQWAKSNFKIDRLPKHAIFSDLNKERTYNNSFAVVRNPYSRLYSWYTYRLNKAYNEDKIPGNRDFMFYCEKNKGFETFVFECDKTPNLQNSIWWTQSKFVSSSTKILKFENLEKDFQSIQQLLKCNIPLQKLNTSNSQGYKEAYNKRTIKFVKDYFSEDFHLFRYNLKL